MLELNKNNVRKYMESVGLASKDDKVDAEELEFGLINNLLKIKINNKSYVIKQALPEAKRIKGRKIKTSRINKECQAIRIFNNILEGIAPEIVHFDEENSLIVMKALPEEAVMLEKDLLDGKVDISVAVKIAEILAFVHNRFMNDRIMEILLDNTYMIRELKVPVMYGRYTNDDKLNDKIQKLGDKLLKNRVCLVHGDCSPRNVFVNGKDIILIDFEQTYFGDPVLDVSYVVSHYFLHGINNHKIRKKYYDAIDMFLKTYFKRLNFRYKDILLRNTALHSANIMWARVDSTAKHDCIKEEVKGIIRNVCRKALANDFSSIRQIMDSIEEELASGR